MMILNSEFVNSLFERISKFWFTKTFNRMDIYQIINGNNLTLRFFEIVYHHNGFLYYSYFPSLFKYNNESIFTNINNFLFMRIPNYCD